MLTAAGRPAESIRDRVARAGEAQRPWGRTPIRARLTLVRRLRQLLVRRALPLAEAVQSGRGTPLAEVLAGEVLPLADACRFLEHQAERVLRPRTLGARGRPLWLVGVKAQVRREPWGTVLVIGPSNYPLLLPGVQLVQALVAGNAVVAKPGAGGRAVLEALAGLFREAGLDPPLFQVLDEEPAAALAAIEAGVDRVVLTGSAPTGEKILASLAPRLVPATLELSGCDAAFVLPDADLDLAARALRFGLTWNGSATCIAPRRVFVAQEMAADLEDRLLTALAGVPPDPRRWELDRKARALVQDALGRGARLLTGWDTREGRPHGPTVVVDAAPGMSLLREETFAPLLALVPVSGAEEALEADRSCPYALGATVFGEESQARALAGRIHAGVVVVNDMIVPTADPRLPFGGRGRSGFGVTRGAEGLLEMTVPKVITVRRGRARWHLGPPRFTDHELVHRYLLAVHGATWRERWRGWRRLLGRLFWGGSAGPGEQARW